jgi:DNA-directed RNA polymerase I, II, and III subunit RPABC1
VILLVQVKIVFFGTSMVKVNAIRSVVADILSQETITGLILVLQNHVTNQALKAIELFSFKVEIFQVGTPIYFPNLIFLG